MTTLTEVDAPILGVSLLASDGTPRVQEFSAPCGCGRLTVWTSTTGPRESAETRTRTVPVCVCAPVGIDDWSTK